MHLKLIDEKWEISKNEQAGSGVYENGKFQRTNKLGPGIWKMGNFKEWTSWVRVCEKREISKNEQAGAGYMKNGKFFKEQTSWVQVLKSEWRASLS